MKKKIVNGFLMLALLVSSMGSFVSCKDYDEDNYVDLSSKIGGEASLRETLQKQVDALELKIADLEKAKCNCGDVQAKINAALADYLKKADLDLSAYLKKSDLDLSEYLKKGELDLSEYLKKSDLDLSEFLKKSDIDLDKINNYALLIANLQTQQQQLEAAIEELKNAKGSAADALSQEQVDQLVVIINNINNIDATATSAKATAEEALKLAQENQLAIAALKSDLEAQLKALQGSLSTVEGSVTELTAKIAALEAQVKALEESQKTLEGTVSTLSASVEDLKKAVAAWNDELKKVNDKAESALAQINTEKGRIDNLEKFYQDLKASNESQFGVVNSKIDSLSKELDQMKSDWQKDLADNLDAAQEYTDKAAALTLLAMNEATEALLENIQKVNDKADANTQKLAELEDALKTTVSQEDFVKALKLIDNALVALADQIDAVSDAVAKLKKEFNSMVSGIVLQGVESPVIGYLSLPLDLNVNIIAAYYGETGGFGMEFPTELARFYVDAANTFDDRDFDVMNIESFEDVEGYVAKSANSKFLGERNGSRTGNAGKIYVTINPSNVDFEGKTLTFVNSQGEGAPIVLEPLKKSDKVLVWGYGMTRANNNNFYEAYATLPYNAIDDAKLKINVSEVKSLAKDAKAALEKRDKESVIKTAVSFAQSMNDLAIARYGVRAAWQVDPESDVNYTVSELGLAVTAVKPLSFNFLRDVKINNVPGMGRLQNLVAKMINKIKIRVPEINFDVNKYFTFKDVEVLEGNKVVVTAQGTLNGTPRDVTVTIYLSDEDVQTLEQLIEEVVISTSNDSRITVDVAELLNDIQQLSTLDEEMAESIDEAKQNMIDGINEYISKANKKLVNIINSANKALQPALIARQYNGNKATTALASQSANLPTKATGEVKLFPTSYTLEYFAPAFKKFVAVTDVYDATTKEALPLAQAQSLAAAANKGTNMMSVKDGNYWVTLNGQTGYIYEIAYSAVDYSGLVVLRKYYIQF